VQLAGQPATLLHGGCLFGLFAQAGILDSQRNLIGDAHGQAQIFL
jgi:hypothetical protein